MPAAFIPGLRGACHRARIRATRWLHPGYSGPIAIIAQSGEGGRHGPFKAYEWNKMKTPTRILVGGPEVTSAFVLMGLALARSAMLQGR